MLESMSLLIWEFPHGERTSPGTQVLIRKSLSLGVIRIIINISEHS